MVRFAVAAGLAAAALGVAAAARVQSRRRSAVAPLDLSRFPSGLILFTDAGCRGCAAARSRLESARLVFTEVGHESDPERFRAAGVTGVPLLVARRPDGTEVGRIAGRIRRRPLRRLVARLG